jgi:two-component system, OmpR family, sensor kinase
VTLRARVLLGFALVALVLVVLSTVLARVTEQQLVAQVDAQLATAASAAGRPAILQGIRDVRGPMMSRDDTLPSSLFVGAVLADGTVATGPSPELGTGVPATTPAQVLAAAESGEPFTTDSSEGVGQWRAQAFAVARRGDVVLVALPLDGVTDTMRWLSVLLVTGTLAILAVLALVAWWVVRLGVRPVVEMADTAGAIAAGDLSRRVPVGDRGTEVGALGLAVNQMLAAIETSFTQRQRADDRLRQFVADASHELRTPVATIRGYAELYRTGALEGAGDLDEAMRRTESEAIRLGRLVDDLLALTRLDAGRGLDTDPVDLGQLAAEAVNDAVARHPNRTVDMELMAPAVARGDADRVRQVFTNLLANALVHTEADVLVRVGGSDAEVVLEVVDHGPGLSDEHKAQATERFWRADPSRVRARGGTGLGLAIVEAIVAAHGGTLALADTPGGGLTVRVGLPPFTADGDVDSVPSGGRGTQVP